MGVLNMHQPTLALYVALLVSNCVLTEFAVGIYLPTHNRSYLYAFFVQGSGYVAQGMSTLQYLYDVRIRAYGFASAVLFIVFTC